MYCPSIFFNLDSNFEKSFNFALISPTPELPQGFGGVIVMSVEASKSSFATVTSSELSLFETPLDGIPDVFDALSITCFPRAYFSGLKGSNDVLRSSGATTLTSLFL